MTMTGAQNLPVDLPARSRSAAPPVRDFQCSTGKDSHSRGAIRETIDTPARLVP